MIERYDLVVQSEQDWAKFGAANLAYIVDPMIFRTADVYLRGRKGGEQTLGAGRSDVLWQAISSNISSLLSFFDALVLTEKLPIIDYDSSWDSGPGTDVHNLYSKCNQDAEDQVLVSVHVAPGASWPAMKAALDELAKKSASGSPELEKSVLQELSAFDYNWQPHLSGLKIADADDLVLKRFMYGFMLFGGYARLTGAHHLIQAKRARLYTALSLGAASADDESALLQEVHRILAEAGYAPQDLTALPPFLPYLLARNPSNPAALLRQAVDLRKDPAVRDYRAWLTSVLRTYEERGKLESADHVAVKQIVRAIRRKFEVPGERPLPVKLTAALIPPSISVEGDASGLAQRLWGWVMEQLPGRRHIKLLTQMGIAAQEYIRLERHLRTLWEQA